jgi:hypothetical protein
MGRRTGGQAIRVFKFSLPGKGEEEKETSKEKMADRASALRSVWWDF